MSKTFLYAACTALASLSGLVATAPMGRAASFTTLYNFASSANGEGNIVSTPVVLDNVLYGSTDLGGTGGAGDGTIFKFDLASGKETTLVDFTGTSGTNPGQAGSGPLSIVGSTVYGSAIVGGKGDGTHGEGLGIVWKLNEVSEQEHVFHAFDDKRGGFPLSGVTPAGGVFYGATDIGGPNETGTLFKLDSSGKLTLLYAFPDTTIGCSPQAGVVLVGTILYGTTSACGAGTGTVFSFNLKTSQASVLHIFDSNNQGTAGARALLVHDGALYGTTGEDGGSGGAGPGTLFKVALASKQYTLMHTFGGAGDGANPGSGLTLLNGLLYGVTQNGGSSGSGTIYSFDPVTGSEAVVHSFSGGGGGDSPDAGLFAYKGALYGSTTDANTDDRGTLFRFVPQ